MTTGLNDCYYCTLFTGKKNEELRSLRSQNWYVANLDPTWTGLLQSRLWLMNFPRTHAGSCLVLMEHLQTTTGTSWYVSKQTMVPEESQKADLGSTVMQISQRIGGQRNIYMSCYK